jgi:uncharacterized protein YdcH (DUF465 family)
LFVFRAGDASSETRPSSAQKEVRMDRETLIERLMVENEEFRHLREEHQHHDRELEELKGTAPLSASQQWRISELKKLKLMAKDRMEAIIRHSTVNA